MAQLGVAVVLGSFPIHETKIRHQAEHLAVNPQAKKHDATQLPGMTRMLARRAFSAQAEIKVI
jgi:hypothetical protein